MPNSRPPLLCDAAAVIGAHQAEVWTILAERYRVAVTGIIVGESHNYPDRRGDRRLIQLAPQVASGTIEQYDATLDELDSFDGRLEDRMLAMAMDPGEKEALALIVERRLPHRFCTGDGPAIRALCHLGLHNAAVSLERALRDVGCAPRLRDDLTEGHFLRMMRRGMRERRELGLE